MYSFQPPRTKLFIQFKPQFAIWINFQNCFRRTVTAASAPPFWTGHRAPKVAARPPHSPCPFPHCPRPFWRSVWCTRPSSATKCSVAPLAWPPFPRYGSSSSTRPSSTSARSARWTSRSSVNNAARAIAIGAPTWSIANRTTAPACRPTSCSRATFAACNLGTWRASRSIGSITRWKSCTAKPEASCTIRRAERARWVTIVQRVMWRTAATKCPVRMRLLQLRGTRMGRLWWRRRTILQVIYRVEMLEKKWNGRFWIEHFLCTFSLKKCS